jgi:GEVED domain/Secretion system C-terminal sorting domain/Bacterial Ig-like domain (group 2)
MRKIYILVSVMFLLVGANVAFAANKYYPLAVTTTAGAGTYCAGGTPSAITAQFTKTFCSGTAGAFSYTYTWYSNNTNVTTTAGATVVAGPTVVTNGVTNSATAVVIPSYTPSTATVGTKYYFCTVSWTTSGCATGTTLTSSNTQAVTVNTQPAAITGGSTTLCGGSTMALSDATSGGTWSSTTTTAASVSTPATSTTNTITGGSAGGTTTISYTIGTCAATRAITVGVVPSSLTATATPTSLCAGTNLALGETVTGGAGVTYSWAGPGSYSAATATATFAVATTNAGIYTLTASAAGCTNITSTTSSVTVNPSPAAITGTFSVCGLGSSSLADATTGGTWSGGTAGIATINASGVATGLGTAGTTTATYTKSGCSSYQTITETAAPFTPTGSATPTTVCAGGTSILSNSAALPAAGYSVASTTYAINTTAPTTTAVSGDDVNSGAITLPFTFNFYGTNYSSIYVCTNGWVSFTSTSTNLGNLAVASMFGTIGASISFTDHDLNTGSGGSITYGTAGSAPNRTFIIWFNGVADYSGGGTNSGQIVLHETTNVIDVMVTSITPGSTTYSSTIGIAGGSSAGQYLAATGRDAVSGLSISTSEGWTFTPLSYSYSWSPASGLSSSTSATPTATVGATTTYTVAVSAGSCVANGTVTVTANALPTLTSAPAVLCSGVPITISGASTYTWTPTTGLSASTGATVTATVGSATAYTVSGTNASGCTGTLAITVNPLPTVTVSPALSCATSSVTASGASTYTWNPTSGLSSSTGASVTASLGNNYTVTGTNAIGCSNTSVAQVGTPPGAIGGTMSVCQGQTTTLTNGTSGGVWTSSDASVATVNSATGVVTGASAGTPGATCTITYTFGTCTPQYATVTLNGTPTISLATTACAPSASLAASGGSSYTWAPSTNLSATTGATVSASPTVTTVYTVTGSNGSCATTKSISVYPTPSSITGGGGSLCAGSTVALSDASSGPSWSSSNTSFATVSGTGLVTGVGPGTVTISYGYSACPSNAATTTITVNALPSTTYTGTTNCTSSGTAMTLAYGGGSGSYSWSPATYLSATTGASVTCTPTSAITYTIVATGTGGCSSTVTLPINVIGTYTPETVTASPSSTCIGGSSLLTGTVPYSGYSVSSTTYSLNTTAPVTTATSGDDVNSGAITLPFTFNFYGTNYSSIYVCTNGWVSFTSTSTNLTNYAIAGSYAVMGPVIDFSVHDLNTSSGGSITYGTAGSAPNRSFIIWFNGVANYSGGGATSGQIVLHETSNIIDLMITSQTTGTTTYSSTYGIAGGASTGQYLAVPGRDAVSGLAIATAEAWRFTPSSFTYAWSPATGLSSTTASSTSLTSAASGANTYTVTATDAGTGCFFKGSATVTGGGALTVALSAPPTVCSGATGTWTMSGSPSGVVYYNINGGATQSITLNASGSGTVSQTISASTTLNLLSETAGSCSNTLSGSATIVPLCYCTPIWYYPTYPATYGYGALASSAHPFTVTGAVGSINDATATNSSNPYTDQTSAGSAYTCTMYIGNSYNITIGNNFNLYASTNDQLWIDFNNNGTFETSESVGGSASWSTVNVSHTITIPSTGVTPGTYRMRAECEYYYHTYPSLLACPNSSTSSNYYGEVRDYTVTIANMPACSGTPSGGTTVASVSTGCSGYSSTLSLSGATSATGLTYQWQSSSDGSTWSNISGATNVTDTVTVSSASIYYRCNVTCTASSATGSSSSRYLQSVMPISGGATVCTAGTVTLTEASAGGTWSTTAGTGSATISTGGVVGGATAGTVTVSYVGAGCTVTYPITVNGAPAAITGAATVCAGSTVTLTESAPGSGGSGWLCSGSSAVATINASGVVTGIAGGTASISYNSGCGTSPVYSITVLAVPASISGGTSPICVGATTTVTDAVSGGSWSGSNYAVASITSAGVVTGISGGTATISYANGCGTAATATVTVNAIPTISGSSSVCVANTITLTPTPSGGTWVSGATGVATVGSSSGIVGGVAVGTANITYTAPTGCTAVYALTVNNSGPASISGGTSAICAGSVTTLTESTTGGTWISSNATIATIPSTGTSVAVTGVSGGTAIITYTNGCGTAPTKTITVNSLPSTTYTGLSNCTTSGTALTLSYGGGSGTYSWSPATYLSATTGASVTCTPTANTVYTITATGTGGCSSTVTLPVYVIGSYTAETPTATPSSTCIGGSSLLAGSVPYSGYSVASTTYAINTTAPTTTAVSGDDVNSGAITLPFTFNFYGTNYSSIYVCTNGWASFTSTSTNLSNYSVSGSYAVMGPVIDFSVHDLNTGSGGSITYGTAGTAPNRKFIIWFNGVANYSGGGATSGQIILYETTNVIDLMITSETTGTSTYSSTYGIAGGSSAGQYLAVPGRDAVSGLAISTAEGWRFSPTSFSYTWSPATGLSASTGSSVTLTSAVSGANTYSVTATDASTGCFFKGSTTVTGGGALSVALSAPASVCSGTTGTWTMTGTPSGTVYYNINGGTTQNITLNGSGIGTVSQTITATTTLNLVSETAGSCSNTLTGSKSISPICYCTPSWVYPTYPGLYGYGALAGASYPFTLTGAIGSIYDATATNSATAYTDQTSAGTGYTCTLYIGSTYNLTIGDNFNSYASTNDQLWIDFNNNGTFETSESVGGSASWSTISVTHTITIPSTGVTPGTYRMRAECEYYYHTYPSLLPCPNNTTSSSYYGDVRDYTVTIANMPACSGAPSAGTTVSTATTGCSGYGAWLSLSGSTAATGLTYQWQSSTDGSTWSNISGATNITDSVTMTTASMYYRCNVTCTATSSTSASTSLYMQSVMPITGSGTSICTAGTMTLSDATPGGTWSYAAGTGTATVSTGGVVGGATAGTITISYAGAGCTQAYPMTVNGAPVTISGSATVCAGASTTLAETSPGSGGSGWLCSGSSAVATINASGVVTGVAGGTASISYNSGCGTSPVYTITVLAVPGAISGGTSGICVGATTTLTDASSGGAWSGSNYAVASVSASGVVTGISGGTATITYSNGCGTAPTATVTINGTPTITGATSVCVANTTTLIPSPGGGSWVSGGTSFATVTSSTGIVTGVAIGTANLTYTSPAGCNKVYAMGVNNTGPASISGGTTAFCAGATITLTDATSGGTWSSSNATIATVGTTGSPVTVTGVSGGTATITYSNGCGTAPTATITVNSLPSTTFTGTTNCTTSGTAFTLSYGGGSGSYTWSPATYLSATTGSSVTCTPTGAITYTVTATGTGGCTSTVTLPVNVVGSFTAETPTALPTSTCIGGSALFTSSVPFNGYSVSSTTYSINTSAPTTTATSGDDVNSGAITLPFSFNFYGTNYSSIYVCTNGWASFTSTSTNLSNYSVSGSYAVMGPVIDFGVHDLNTGSGGSITYGTAGTSPNRSFIIWYNGVANYTGGGAISGQIVLHETSNIIDLMITSQTTGTSTYSSTYGIAGGSSTGQYLAPSGRDAVSNLAISTAEGWRFTPTNFSYVWSPATNLSATTGSSVTLSPAVSGSNTYSVTATDAGTGCFFKGSATVTGGAAMTVAIAAPTNVCPGSTGVYSLTGAPSGTVYYNINGGSTANITLNGTGSGTISQTISAATTLNLLSITAGSCSNTLSSSRTINANCYCTPLWYYPSYPSTYGYGALAGATHPFTLTGAIGSINDATATNSSTAYTDQTAAGTGYSCSMYIGGTYSVTIGNNFNSYASTNDQIWIDFNNNGTFESSESVGGSASWSTISVTHTITIPATGVTAGTYRMRAECEYYYHTYPSLLPCPNSSTSSNYYGEVRDYTVYIVTPCSGTPTAGTTSATATSGCSGYGTTIGLTGATSAPGITYQWQSSTDGATWTAVSGATNTTYSTTVSTPSVYYSCVVGCSVSSLSATSTSTNMTAVMPISGTGVLCTSSPVTFTDATSGGSWGSSFPSTATVTSGGVVTGLLAGNSTISYTGTGCTQTYNITVNSTPAAITGEATVCAGATTALSETLPGVYGTGWTSSSTSLATISSSGVVTGVAAGTPTITYNNSCGTVTYPVTVNALPVAGSITGTATVCAGSTTTLADATGTSGGTWSSGTTSVATVNASGVVTGVSAGTATISYAAITASCGTAYATKVVTVNALPVAGTITGTASVCAGGATTSLADATGTSGGTWSSATTSVATVNASGVVTGVTAGTATISYAAITASCGTAYATQVVTVNSLPVAGTITGTATVCAGSTTTLADATGTTGGTWSSGTTSVATVNASGVVTGVSAGSATISYAAITASCGTAYATKVVTVNALPVAGTITGTASVCASGATTSLADATGTSGGTWSSGATSVATVGATGVVTGVAVGTATISYAAITASCGTAYATQVVTVNALPVAGAISGTTSVCPGSTTTLADATGTPGGTWSSGTTSIATVDATGVVHGVAAGTATISYAAITPSCGTAYATATYTVNAAPVVGTITGTPYLCLGNTSTLADATGTPGGTWSCSDGSSATISATGVVTGIVPGTVVISYAAITPSCGTAYATQSFTVDGIPAITAGSTTNPICTGGTLALNVTVIGGTAPYNYNWTNGSGYTSTVAAPTRSSVNSSMAGVYSVSVTDNFGCSAGTTTTASITVDAAPSIGTLSVLYSNICAGATDTFTQSGAVSYPSTGSVVYNFVDPSGFVFATSSSLTSGTHVAYTPGSVASSGIYSLTATYTEAGCSVNPATTGYVTVNAAPAITLTETKPVYICPTSIDTFTAVATGGYGSPSFTWYGPGVATTTSGSVGTYTVAPVTSGIYTVTTTYSGVYGCLGTATTGTIVLTGEAWIPTAATTDWNTASNWTCGWVPTVTDTVLIQSGVNEPYISGSEIGYAYNLNIASGAVITIASGASLNVKGGLSGSGAVKGAGVLAFNGTGLGQVIHGNVTANNVEINNTNGVGVPPFTTDSFSMTGTLKLTAGNFSSNNKLVLIMQDSSGTGACGRIDSLTAGGGTISGKVIIQQTVQAFRAFRFFAHPFVDSIPLSQLENSMDISGSYGSAHGFTNTIGNNPSAFWYHTTVGNSSITTGTGDPGWKPFTWAKDSVNVGGIHVSGDSNEFKRFEAIRLMFRGSKGQGLDSTSGYYITPATVRMWGNIETGTLDMILQKGTAFTNPAAPNYLQDYNLKGNPYPSAIDLGRVVNNAYNAGMLNGGFAYVWNPYAGAAGIYETVDETSYAPFNLPANAGFMVRAKYGHDSSSLHFTESLKTTGATYSVLKTAADAIALNVYDNNYHLWDKLTVKFNESATDGDDDAYDAGKPVNPGMNFYSWSADRHPLSNDVRPFQAGKVVPLGIASDYLQDFIIRADQFHTPAGAQVYLHDKLLNKYVLMAQGTEYQFSITKSAATQGDERFELGLATEGAPLAAQDALKVLMLPNPASNTVTVSFSSSNTAATAVRILSVEGVCVLTQDLGEQQNGSTTLAIDNLASGIYMVEFTSGSNRVVQRLVKE